MTDTPAAPGEAPAIESASARDCDLVHRFLRSRDETAFRGLYAAHTPFLYRLAFRMLRCDSRAAEEAVQDVWVRAAERFAQFRSDSSLRTWLAGIAINRCREELRRAGAPDGPPSDSIDPATSRGRVEGIDLERAIANLPDGAREVLVLHDVEGYTHREIARLLGIEEGTSKSQLWRARRAVRDRLGPVEWWAKERA